jgi:hypothetical protein
MNISDAHPPIFKCPDGYSIVQSNMSESGYICQSYSPKKPVQSLFINVTELTGKVKDPIPKDPIIIKSAFFMQNPIISSS